MKLLKTLFRVVMGIFGGKKFVDLDGDGKVETLREEVSGIFAQFIKMNDKLNKVNDNLQGVIEDEKIAKEIENENLKLVIAEAELKLQKSDSTIDKAYNEILVNQRMQEKVKEFIL